MSKLEAKTYERILKEDLVCWHCGSRMKNMPILKTHLQEEWDKQAKQGKAKMGCKRKLEERQVVPELENNAEGGPIKKVRTEV